MSNVKKLVVAMAMAVFMLVAGAGVAAADDDPGMTHNVIGPDMTHD